MTPPALARRFSPFSQRNSFARPTIFKTFQIQAGTHNGKREAAVLDDEPVPVRSGVCNGSGSLVF